MSFQTALKILGRAETILGRAETPGIDKLDQALGGLILVAGAGAGIAAVGGAALAPAGAIAALWGWVDQKSEALTLLRGVVGRLSRTIGGASGDHQRPRLIAAAHTAIAGAAFFEELGARNVTASLTEDDRRALVSGSTGDNPLFETLYRTAVPSPGPERGFAENLGGIRMWMIELGDRTQRMLAGLDGHRMFDIYALAEGATRRYESHYYDLAVAVPEFQAWTSFNEHAATRHRIEQLGSRFDEGRHRVSAALAVANHARLRDRVVPGGVDRDSTALTFPLIGELFIEPGYRICTAGDETRTGDESWWDARTGHDDLLDRLESHAATETELPMLILGHPGAGKSMLTKVLAARLSDRDFIVAWVSLRAVSSDVPVLDQIEEGLRLATHQRIAWADLPLQRRRVVMLDGLDELLQASPADRGGYLQEVAGFQRHAAELGQPVSVVVTSRTIVADRVRIPRGLPVAKLDNFDQRRTTEWLRRWNAANRAAIAAGAVRAVALETVSHHPHLAAQPLLLLMLSIYAADPSTPPVDEDMRITELYEQLIHLFVRREKAKRAPEEADEATAIERLSIAALAMFNRGQQHVTEAGLGTDLAALTGDDGRADRPEAAGRKLLAEFFFVHAAEATGVERTERVYEFLHATFGEYLIARRVVEELRDITDKAQGGRRKREPDDGRLRALVSHRALAGRRSIEEFASEILAGLDEEERSGITEVLETLIRRSRQAGPDGGFAGYRPNGADRLRELAAYSANLFLLRLACEPSDGHVSLQVLLPDPIEVAWRQTVMLWRAGLGTEGWAGMLSFVEPVDPSPTAITRGRGPVARTGTLEQMTYHRLIGDHETQENYAIGALINDGLRWAPKDWFLQARTWLIPAAAGFDAAWLPEAPPDGTAPDDIAEVYQLMARFVVRLPGEIAVDRGLTRLVRLLAGRPDHRLSVAVAVCRRSELLALAPDLADPALYRAIPMAAMMDAARPANPPEAWQALRGQLPDPTPEDTSRALGLLISDPAVLLRRRRPRGASRRRTIEGP